MALPEFDERIWQDATTELSNGMQNSVFGRASPPRPGNCQFVPAAIQDKVAYGQAVPVRTDYTASEVRRFARRAKDGAQARRLLALAAVLDGASREEAAKIGGMDRQTLRDWVIRYNEQGPDGLINIPSPGAPPKLDDTHKAFLRRLVEEGPIPAIHGVVRWRACDLIMRCMTSSGSRCRTNIYRALKDLGFSHVSAGRRPTSRRRRIAAFKKSLPYAWRKSARTPARHASRGLVPG